jgi:hypothetical protein
MDIIGAKIPYCWVMLDDARSLNRKIQPQVRHCARILHNKGKSRLEIAAT